MYKFNNLILAESWKKHPSKIKNKEFCRLESLGDKILSFHLMTILYENKNSSACELSLNLSNMVNNKTLAILGQFLIKDIIYNGELNESIIADCFEAWIAAVYLDNGPVLEIIKVLWSSLLKIENFKKSPKNLVQEFAQKKGIKPIYLYNEKKKDDISEFEATLIIDNIKVIGLGNSKKTASEKAAKNMLSNFINQQKND